MAKLLKAEALPEVPLLLDLPDLLMDLTMV